MLDQRSVTDELLSGWDQTPGIVSVWAGRDGQALIWRRVGGQLLREQARFRPWLFAAHLDDLSHTGMALQAEQASQAQRAAFAYRELEGPSASYRFLISAHDGRALERALLAGASQRLGRSLSNLNDLDDYYRVGPVEQYLIASGRVYFRDLEYEALHRLQFDLETTALDPRRGRIFLVALRDSRGFEQILEAPAPADEPALIEQLCALIRERDPDVIENHNLFGFDLPFLVERAAALQIPLRLGRAGAPPLPQRRTDIAGRRRQVRFTIGGRELIDTLDAVLRHDFVSRDLSSYRLKDVARSFGVAGPERVYLRGEQIFETYKRQPELLRRYALDDVQEVDGLSRRLLGASFALAGMAPRPYERMPVAGPAMGILEPMLVRAYLRANMALPRQIGTGPLEPHTGGMAQVFATGIAEHVVKADVASLYPSLMRIYQIGPACDRLGALLALVDQLTERRLAHKAAARSAPPGSSEASRHHALQAAMKLIINSAYGYMGAGSMALFADRHAADEVTRRGRELLSGLLAQLRTRGVALIEADTDGVYFAVPAAWEVEQERRLVAELGATLPAGIRLEYEGRYRAMLSHEVKNYALLTYSGELILRGVALRSSRAEPFGERFLQAALRCALQGDSPGLQRVFRETVAAIRERRLTAADVATRVRLRKSPEDYLNTRNRLREPGYEALLNAGRRSWAPGERVRFYRAQHGQAVWLPDENEDQNLGDQWEGAEPVGDEILDPGASSPAYPLAQPATILARLDERHDYDIEYYVTLLINSYVSRLKRAYAAADFAQLFRLDGQLSMFDRPVEQIEPLWIRAKSAESNAANL